MDHPLKLSTNVQNILKAYRSSSIGEKNTNVISDNLIVVWKYLHMIIFTLNNLLWKEKCVNISPTQRTFAIVLKTARTLLFLLAIYVTFRKILWKIPPTSPWLFFLRKNENYFFRFFSFTFKTGLEFWRLATRTCPHSHENKWILSLLR